MNKELLQLIMQLITTLINNKVNKGLQQGFVSVDTVSTADEEQRLKQQIADHVGANVDELFPGDAGEQSA